MVQYKKKTRYSFEYQMGGLLYFFSIKTVCTFITPWISFSVFTFLKLNCIDLTIQLVEYSHCSVERMEFMKCLTALVTPSLYIEPFCGVNVEAQLCGIPVIAQDFGAFTETIEHFRTGLLCHTLADYCFGVQMALDNKFDRKYIRQRAIKKYDMYIVAHQYEYAFRSILDIFNGKNGWYSPDSHFQSVEMKIKHNSFTYYQAMEKCRTIALWRACSLAIVMILVPIITSFA
jgi:hypothetical protein